MATIEELLAQQVHTLSDEEIWTKDISYPVYDLYSDPVYVRATDKTIPDFSNQVCVKGERNSQYIGFEISRYPEGIDLIGKRIYIHYQTPNGGDDATPCNVEYSDTSIRLWWIVPGAAAETAATIHMMIYADGMNETGERYIWKTLPAAYPIKDSLDIGGNIPEPDPSWYEQFVWSMEQKVITANDYANQAKISKDSAAASATASAKSASDADKTLKSATTTISNAAQTAKDDIQAKADATLLTIPEDYTQMDQAVKGLQDKAGTYSALFSNALAGGAAGKELLIQDSAEAGLRGLNIYGKSEQVSTTGAQLFDASKITTKSIGGATVTNNSDGSFAVSGSGNLASAYVNAYAYTREESLSILKPGIYACNNSTVIPYFIFKVTANGTFKELRSSLSNKTITITEEDLKASDLKLEVGYYTAQGYAIVPGVIKPMVCKGNAALPWEPHTGGKPSPSPEYPQEIVSAGDIGNLFSIKPSLKGFTNGGITIVDVNKDTLTFNGTSTGSTLILLTGTDVNNLLKNGKSYCLKAKSEDVSLSSSFHFQYWSPLQPGVRDEGKGVILEYRGEASWNFAFIIPTGTVLNNVKFKIMVNEGTSFIPWKPYTGGGGSIAENVVGKNLANVKTCIFSDMSKPERMENGFIISPTSNLTRIIYIPCNLEKGVSYYLSFNYRNTGTYPIKDNDVRAYIPFQSIPEQYYIKGKFVPDDSFDKIGIYMTDTFIGKDIRLEITNVQVEQSDKNTSYESYKLPQQATIPTPNGLPGIKLDPAATDYNYIDSEGNKWICDEIRYRWDGTGEYVQRINDLKLSTSQKWNHYTSEGVLWHFLSTEVSDMFFTGETNIVYYSEGVCNYAKFSRDFKLSSENNTFSLYFNKGYSNWRLGIWASSLQSKELFDKWITENDVHVYYPIKEPIITPLPADTITQLKALHTNYPTTVVSNDADACQRVEYVMDTKTYIDKKINELTVALVAAGSEA